MTSPDYEDPARENFTRSDLISIFAVVAVLCIGFFLWGY